mmetsp:Transcript_37507/g.112464  ORF Transcript_37507/g.112464 Transcript_37507/m.112464 type:complete len:80 (+) Transcript_37507:572-811(+)
MIPEAIQYKKHEKGSILRELCISHHVPLDEPPHPKVSCEWSASCNFSTIGYSPQRRSQRCAAIPEDNKQEVILRYSSIK